MKHSIRKQMAITFICLLGAALIIVWGINKFFLQTYYLSNKESTLIETFDMLDDEAGVMESDFEETFKTTFQNFCSKNNLSCVVTTQEGQILYANGMESRLESILFAYFTQQDGNEENNILERTDNYYIQKHMDRFSKTDYLEIWGVLQNGYCFIVRTPLESIKDSVALSNRFLAVVGLIIVVLSALVVWVVSSKFTKPIVELTQISKRMADLDFDVKYKSGGNNEIGELGQNFNRMSTELEAAISDLKTANNELQKDIEKKTQIDEMRKEFLANVSHELKTPIALIQGYAEGLKENIADDEESRDFYCDVIMDEASKMNKMVKKLLTLNQLEFGNDQVVMERFDIVALIRGILQSSHILIEQNNANVLFAEENPIAVWGDEFKVEEVVTNYLTNALNHLDGERMVDIRIVKEEKKITVSVFNTGNPIPEEDIEKIWIKFYKVDKARTRAYGGSGIGLSIVKAIMTSMNQECGVKNYHNGVKFWFTLDLV